MRLFYRPQRIFSIAALLLCLSPGLKAEAKSEAIPFHLQQQSPGKTLGPSDLSRQVESRIFESTNGVREGKKLKPLASEELLAKAAHDHAQDMMKRNYLSHFSPEKKSVVDRLKKYRPKLNRSVGENLHTIASAGGLFDPKAIAEQMMKDWMNSSSHRKNILAKNFEFLGVGCTGDGSRIFCVQVFGGP
ncbi:MAG TPA: CAP domain-containing protein [bacterium]|nr:CAP domain-containing protein [bacterium]